MKITEKDMVILRELQKDCSRPLKELSKKTGIPLSTLHSRIGKLKREGVIKKFSAVIDPNLVGLGTTSLVFLKIEQATGQEARTHSGIAAKIAELPQIKDVFLVTGEFDLCLKIKGSSLTEIANLVMSRLRGMEEITDSRTYVIFQNVKETSEVHM